MNTTFLKRNLKPLHPGSAGFTLAETVIAMGALALFVVVCFSGIVFNRVTSMKAKDEAIAMDFLLHYAETVKAMPFNNVVPNFPINPLYNGVSGAITIAIPADDSWVALNTTNYETFHPDLIWLHNLNPKLKVTLETQSVGGSAHDKHLNIEVAWDAPLGRGSRTSVQVDVIRNKDL